MKRTIYFTGQVELDESTVAVDTGVGPDGQLWCSGVVRNLPSDLPKHSRIWLEAYNKTYLHRIDLGPAAGAVHFAGRCLDRLPAGSRVTFRVKVVVPDEGGFPVLVAARDGIKTQADQDHGESILPIRAKSGSEMGHELWRLYSLDDGSGGYELWINRDAGSLYEDVESGKKSVLGLIMPCAIREILQGLFGQAGDSVPDVAKSQWRELGQVVLGVPGPPEESADSAEEGVNLREWIDRFVRVFCVKYGFEEGYSSHAQREHSEEE